MKPSIIFDDYPPDEKQRVIEKYNGFSDFMRNATKEDKRIVFEEVTRQSTKDQKESVCTHCDCKYARVERNLCPCVCHK